MRKTESMKCVPVVDKESWLIGPNPTDLGPLQGEIRPGKPFGGQEVVDHHVWRDREGMWRCWACVRHTAVGRLFYGWKAARLEDTPWTPTGVEMRRDQRFGESLADRGDGIRARSEWIQSPFVVPAGDKYFMFYGGECFDPSGRILLSSICLALSDDGVTFTRYENPEGQSWLFLGPGEARDPCVVRIDGKWFCYYSGAETGRSAPNKVYVRTSDDLVHWSASREVHWGGSAGAEAYQCECPHVVSYRGCFYLFRTKDYAQGLTYVYRSEDPFDFGVNGDKCLIGQVDVAAPEVITDGEEMYVTSNKDLWGGVRLHRLRWVEGG